jgi:hypothetical protein
MRLAERNTASGEGTVPLPLPPEKILNNLLRWEIMLPIAHFKAENKSVLILDDAHQLLKDESTDRPEMAGLFLYPKSEHLSLCAGKASRVVHPQWAKR